MKSKFHLGTAHTNYCLTLYFYTYNACSLGKSLIFTLNVNWTCLPEWAQRIQYCIGNLLFPSVLWSSWHSPTHGCRHVADGCMTQLWWSICHCSSSMFSVSNLENLQTFLKVKVLKCLWILFHKFWLRMNFNLWNRFHKTSEFAPFLNVCEFYFTNNPGPYTIVKPLEAYFRQLKFSSKKSQKSSISVQNMAVLKYFYMSWNLPPNIYEIALCGGHYAAIPSYIAWSICSPTQI